MSDANDMELLGDYARNGSETAFAELVRRHISLVYSAALRHVGIAAQAEEITQVVFIILARKAGALRPATILEGWLYETTRLTALSSLRGERRRQFREQEAYMQSTLRETNDISTWNEISPLLDEALARLGKKDRDAVILRFFKEKSVRDVAATMQVNESAAQRRILRALEKLRNFFALLGVESTTAIIAGAISANSIQMAPAGLAKAVSSVAFAKGAVASTSTLTLIEGALKLMAWTKAKNALIAGIILIFAAGATTVSLVQIRDYTRHNKIAETLLKMHHQWMANDYKAQGMTIPGPLYKDNWSGYSAGILGAYVLYHYTNNGIEWDKGYQIWRPNTNTTTWTLFEVGYPVDTNLVNLGWQHKLATVTGDP